MLNGVMDFLAIVWDTTLQNITFINLLFCIAIVFFERKSPKSVWAWLLLLYFVPVVGFVFYLLLGADMKKRKMFRIKEVEDHISEAIRQQEQHLKSLNVEEFDTNLSNYTDLVMYNLRTSGAVITGDNDVEILTDGNVKFEHLIEDIRSAEHFIHIQYYIIKNDVLFERIRRELVKKAAEGVEVRILFDSMGCRTVSHSCWKQLNEEGIKTAEFFPAFFKRLQLRINYRNHRKIVVIDNKIGYVGGFNIGKEYIGLDEKFGYWRDTHLRIQGSGILGLHLRFMLDWNYAAQENLFGQRKYFEKVYSGERDNCLMQIISSGPDTTRQMIHDNYLRLITKAKERIYIQSPYFIPDESVMDALMIAVHSGVEVNIMIPCKPDHPFVYWATYSYIGDLVMAGANCYTYDNGFLHAKGIIVDGKVFCYGTANMDIRSFALNFEVNAIVYNERKAKEMEECFLNDLQFCTKITRNMYAGRRLWIRMKEQVCRLMSPVL
jgi:cardiolipin synthase